MGFPTIPGIPESAPTGLINPVLDYDFGNFEIELTEALTRVDNGLTREVTAAPAADELAVATFNVENLDANEPQSKFDALAVDAAPGTGCTQVVR